LIEVPQGLGGWGEFLNNLQVIQVTNAGFKQAILLEFVGFQ
jgi:hypothetical protein